VQFNSIHSNRMPCHYNINNNINRDVTIFLSVSCDVFHEYSNIPFTVDRDRVREVLNMTIDDGMKRLSQDICTHVLLTIYDDLERKREFHKIRTLVEKSQLFHIHGRTARDILYPNAETDDPHAHHGRVVFVCTHC
jgi:hypothetical protein